MSLEGASGVFMTEKESDFHDLVHILAQIQKLMNEAWEILDKIAKDSYRFEHEESNRKRNN